MVQDALVETQIALIRLDGCIVHGVAESKYGETVILYSPAGRFDLYGRIVYACGAATKRYVNDLSLHITPLDNAPDKAWYLQYIRILGDKMNRGFGSVMLSQLLQLAEREGIAYIEGRMQQAEHREHQERLRHFYTKFGFAIADDGRLRWQNGKLASPSIDLKLPDKHWAQRLLHKISKKDLHLF